MPNDAIIVMIVSSLLIIKAKLIKNQLFTLYFSGCHTKRARYSLPGTEFYFFLFIRNIIYYIICRSSLFYYYIRF